MVGFANTAGRKSYALYTETYFGAERNGAATACRFKATFGFHCGRGTDVENS